MAAHRYPHKMNEREPADESQAEQVCFPWVSLRRADGHFRAAAKPSRLFPARLSKKRGRGSPHHCSRVLVLRLSASAGRPRSDRGRSGRRRPRPAARPQGPAGEDPGSQNAPRAAKGEVRLFAACPSCGTRYQFAFRRGCTETVCRCNACGKNFKVESSGAVWPLS